MSDEETIEVYNQRAEAYRALIQTDDVDPHLLAFMNLLEPNSYVLDLGCGPALSSSIMVKNGLRVDPVDASAEMVKLANASFHVNARQATFAEIDGEDIYDGIWASFCLLHANREALPTILQALHKSLKLNGVMHLTMKLGEGARRDGIGRFYTYYTEPELVAHLQAANFTITATEQGEAKSFTSKLEPWIMLRSVKKAPFAL